MNLEIGSMLSLLVPVLLSRAAMAAPELLVTADAPAPAGGSPLGMFPLMIAMVAIIYFLIIRPQQKELKEQEKLIASLQKGDAVVTGSGLHGKVYEVQDATVLLEVADRVRITVDKSSVRRKLIAAPADAAKGN